MSIIRMPLSLVLKVATRAKVDELIVTTVIDLGLCSCG